MGAWLLISCLVALAHPSPAVEAPTPLVNARRLVDELRYEEAVVEYQRYLSQGGRPVGERARALLELGFLHSVLGDEASARGRALEGLELNPDLTLPQDAPAKLTRFLSQMRDELNRIVRVEALPKTPESPPELIRVAVKDQTQRVHKVLLRHALSPNGPFYAAVMACHEAQCQAQIPPISTQASYSAWYFVEAQDKDGNALARLNSPAKPAQVPILRRSTWYKNPWVWGGTAAALLTAGAIVFLASPAPASR